MIYLVDGDIVDTEGDNYTYRDVWCEIEDGKYFFYEKYYGAKPSKTQMITDKEEIDECMRLIKLLTAANNTKT